MEQSYHSFLMALKGKTVTIYRGGPESKTGRLLDVKPDYITLYAQNNNNNNNNNDKNKNNNKNNNNDQNNNQNTVVYYQVQHVKSISEDSKTNSSQVFEEQEEIEYFEAEDYYELIEQLTGETIQINQGGPESKYGKLVGLSGDFLVMFTEDDGIVYTNIHHVKSVSKYNQNNQDDEEGNDENEVQIPEWVCADNFQDVFKHFSHQWVSINRGGPEAMEGVLVENAGGHYTLVNNQEVMRIHPFHIQSISGGSKGHLKQNQNNNQNENSENNEKSSEQSEESSHEESSSSNEESSSTSRNRRSTGKKSSRKSSRRRKTSSSSNRETVVKTIDYIWKKH
ncbi:MAG TPA: spore coat protein [Bacillales bacterium]|nr:spore coat protein [Bacillales bacterium]